MLRKAGSLLVICCLLMLGAWIHGVPTGSPAPVIANASFSFQTPIGNSVTVGTLSATGSPTSWAITAGNTLGGFAINSSGVITTTTGSLLGSSGSETLTVTATGASGTGTNPNIVISWSASGSAPIINTASFSLQTPTTNGATVGTLTASGSPTSWAITAGDPLCGFMISNTGVITTSTGSLFGTGGGSETLTVTATNAFGTGTNSSITITWAPSSGAPVIANNSFSFTTPATTGATVGTLSASGSPTSWAITAGDPLGGFAISNAGLITITTGSIFGSGSGSETLTVTATNSFGTGSNPNINITWSSSGSAPVINSAAFSITTPVTNGGNVGTLTASGSPTSWAITAGDPSVNFAISNSGVITTTAAAVTNLGTSSGSQTLTVTATNGFGTGSNNNIIINYAPFNPANCSNTTIANLPMGNFGINAGGTANNANYAANGDGTTGITAFGYFATIPQSFTVPQSCVYTFTINALQTVNTGVSNQNSLMVLVDWVQIPAVGQTVGNNIVQFATTTTAAPYQFSIPLSAGTHILAVGFCLTQNAALSKVRQGVHANNIIIAETGTPMTAEPAGNVDPYQYPTSALSFWKTPIGSGAIWSNATDNDTLAITGSPSYLNWSGFSSSYFEGQNTDPIGTWTNHTAAGYPWYGPFVYSFHIPLATTPGPGSDTRMYLADAANPRYAYSSANGTSVSGTSSVAVTVNYAAPADNYSQNYVSSQINQALGIIRVQEVLTDGVIAHTLLLGLQYSQVATPTTSYSGIGWPITNADASCAYGGACTGPVQWGALIGIPSVAQGGPNCSSLGLTTYGVMLCVALQNYGAVHNINSGSTAVNTLFGEWLPSTAPNYTTWSNAIGVNIFNAWATVRPYLRIMRNNLPTSIKGGGTPLVARPAGLQKNLPAIDLSQ